VPATTTVVSQVFFIEERGRDLFDAAQRLDLEGIVAKRKADPYAPDTIWYKIKNRAYTQIEGAASSFTHCLEAGPRTGSAYTTAPPHR
jgi:ATP-dependent DNA ligase